jgi:hypothetical protein
MHIEVTFKDQVSDADIVAACAFVVGVRPEDLFLLNSHSDREERMRTVVVKDDGFAPPGFMTVSIGRVFSPDEPKMSGEEAARRASMGGIQAYGWDSSTYGDVLVEFTDGVQTGRIAFDEDDDGNLINPERFDS